jgi:hypothetical protein
VRPIRIPLQKSSRRAAKAQRKKRRELVEARLPSAYRLDRTKIAPLLPHMNACADDTPPDEKPELLIARSMPRGRRWLTTPGRRRRRRRCRGAGTP